jgi:hypothetical protein
MTGGLPWKNHLVQADPFSLFPLFPVHATCVQPGRLINHEIRIACGLRIPWTPTAVARSSTALKGSIVGQLVKLRAGWKPALPAG